LENGKRAWQRKTNTSLKKQINPKKRQNQRGPGWRWLRIERGDTKQSSRNTSTRDHVFKQRKKDKAMNNKVPKKSRKELLRIGDRSCALDTKNTNNGLTEAAKLKKGGKYYENYAEKNL